MARIGRVRELEWWGFRHPQTGDWWPLVFTAPGLCKYWDGSWCGITVFLERTIYLDPRPYSHSPSIAETAQHEVMHALIGYERSMRDEHFIRRVSPGLHDIIPMTLPAYPDGIESLRRKCYRWERERDELER